MAKLNKLEKELHEVEEDRRAVVQRVHEGTADATDYAMLRLYREREHRIYERAGMQLEHIHGLRYKANGHTLLVCSKPSLRYIRYCLDGGVV